MAGRKSDFTLTKLDDLFTTQAQRDEEQLSKIRDIPLELIDDFPDHPFKVRDDEDMNKDYGDGANPVILKSEFIMSLCEQLIGGTNLGAKQMP